MSNLELITKEINTELEKAEIQKVLLTTTFKGLSLVSMKTAIFEGMSRGFQFKDFLQKDVYAIPYGQGYSLITSIDFSRKIVMRSGVVGVSEPKYVDDKDGNILTCSMTVKRNINGHIGEFPATVYFNEYNTGHNLWKSKPRTMIAKVAEMHALRKACPEELAKAYVEEEMQKEVKLTEALEIDTNSFALKLESTKSLEELKTVWASIPIQAKNKLEELKNNLKSKYENA